MKRKVVKEKTKEIHVWVPPRVSIWFENYRNLWSVSRWKTSVRDLSALNMKLTARFGWSSSNSEIIKSFILTSGNRPSGGNIFREGIVIFELGDNGSRDGRKIFINSMKLRTSSLKCSMQRTCPRKNQRRPTRTTTTNSTDSLQFSAFRPH